MCGIKKLFCKHQWQSIATGYRDKNGIPYQYKPHKYTSNDSVREVLICVNCLKIKKIEY